jgi:hypothetical protein
MIARLHLSLAAIALLALACGSNQGMVHRSDAQFEACEPMALPSGTPVAITAMPVAVSADGGVSASEGAETAEARAPRSPRYSGDPTCQPVCGSPWDHCIRQCPDDRMPCVVACENEYRACMRGCF